MFGSGVLEIAIGMLFIYFLLSSICSAVSEWIGGFTASRSRTLEVGIRNLLNDTDGATLATEILNHPLVKTLESPAQISLPALLAKWWGRFKRPVYLSSDLFVTALLDQVAPLGKDSPARSFVDVWNSLHDKLSDQTGRNEELQRAAEILKEEAARLTGSAKKQKDKEANATQAEAERAKAAAETWKALVALASANPNDLDALRKKLEGWYEEGMERVSGWYKRKTQLVLTVIAAVVSLTFNADGVSFLEYLQQDSTARETIAAAARDFVQNPANEPKSASAPPAAAAGSAADAMGSGERQLQALTSQLRSYSLPIGWDLTDFKWSEVWASFTRDEAPAKDATTQAIKASPAAADFVATLRRLPTTRRDWMLKGLGLLFSTIAMSMGATFYFDLLKQLVNIRSTGVPPDEMKKK